MRNGYNLNYANNFLNSIKNGIYDDTIDILSIYNIKKDRLLRVYKNKDNYNNFTYKINYRYKENIVETEIDILKTDIYIFLYNIVSKYYGKIVDNKINDVLCPLIVK